MDLKRPNKLRISGTPGDTESPPAGDSTLGSSAFPVNEVAELVADTTANLRKASGPGTRAVLVTNGVSSDDHQTALRVGIRHRF